MRSSIVYSAARAAKHAVQEQWHRRTDPDRRVVRLQPKDTVGGSVLVSYYLEPYLLDPNKPIPPSHPSFWHPNHWECTEIVRCFLELGYAVDVISWRNRAFVPSKTYSIFLDVRHNMQRIAPLLPESCLKIFHIDVAHTLFQNWAEAKRLLEVQHRRGVTLRPRRFEVPNLGIEYADCATMLGNLFTAETFAYAKKPIYPVPISTPVIYPSPAGKDFNACRRSFLWLGSGGLVRKGLDLALEAFAGMPDFRLVVCGPIEREKDFEQAYTRELYQLPNIETVGWVDLDSPKFLEIMRTCVGMIYPSCCEGQCGGVITAMAGGLIPVISYESGVDVHDFGAILQTCTIGEIQQTVRQLAHRPAAELESMAGKAWAHASEHHSRDSFAREWRRTLQTILRERNHAPSLAAPVLVSAAIS